MSLDFFMYYEEDENEITVFNTNITHNLGKMAGEAGIYYALWSPEEKGYKRAKDITRILEDGLRELKTRQKHYEKFNAENGWGLYEHFVPFVQGVLDACYRYPTAKIRASR